MVDDLGWQDVACYYRDYHDEEPFYETPNMDRIAARGIRFMQAYSPAVTCAPSRAAFLTGQYTPHNGVYHVNMGCQIPRPRRDSAQMLDPYYVGRIMPGKPVIAKALKQAGYTTAHVGKWHVSGASGYPAPIQVGFDFSFDHKKKYNDPEIYDESDPKQTNFPGLFAQPKHRLKDAFNDSRFTLLKDERPYDSMTDLTQRWIRKAARGEKPFFLNLCPNLVHGPVMTRDRKRLAHYCQKLGIPFPTHQGSISDPNKPGQHNPYYASMVDSVDWIVGQIVHTLETTDDPRNPGHKLIDNTYVFVSSDNGAAQKLRNWRSSDGKLNFEKVSDNDPLREGKAWAYEGGCRIPFLVMGPGIKPGSVNKETPVNLIDLFPTFLAIAGQTDHGKLDLDGCNLLPVLKGQNEKARLPNGEPRDTLYFHYPVLNGAFSTIRRGPWKLMKNTGGPMNTAPKIQLFRLYHDDGSDVDLGEQRNVANQFPEIKQQMLSDLERWLSEHGARVPYRNAAYNKGDLPGQIDVPAITQRGSEGDQIWATFETSDGKSKVVDAFLLYTTNPGKTEEWFRAEAKIATGRVTAAAQPGMTHGVFCLLDENNFLIHSELVPGMQKYGNGKPISAVLKDGYAFRPGLFSLIELASRVQTQAEQSDQKTNVLLRAIRSAEQTVKKPVDVSRYTKAIRDLRKAIRSLNVPAARHAALNWFPRSAD
jgi:arylsulfatase A-like enzyme